MKREKFDSLVPEFFCALGKLSEQKPAFFWRDLFYVVKYLLEIFAYFQELEEGDFPHGLDDLVSPLFEGFINSVDNSKALRELMEELAKVRAFLRQELEYRRRDWQT
jgi:septin family protein